MNKLTLSFVLFSCLLSVIPQASNAFSYEDLQEVIQSSRSCLVQEKGIIDTSEE